MSTRRTSGVADGDHNNNNNNNNGDGGDDLRDKWARQLRRHIVVVSSDVQQAYAQSAWLSSRDITLRGCIRLFSHVQRQCARDPSSRHTLRRLRSLLRCLCCRHLLMRRWYGGVFGVPLVKIQQFVIAAITVRNAHALSTLSSSIRAAVSAVRDGEQKEPASVLLRRLFLSAVDGDVAVAQRCLSFVLRTDNVQLNLCQKMSKQLQILALAAVRRFVSGRGLELSSLDFVTDSSLIRPDLWSLEDILAFSVVCCRSFYVEHSLSFILWTRKNVIGVGNLHGLVQLLVMDFAAFSVPWLVEELTDRIVRMKHPNSSLKAMLRNVRHSALALLQTLQAPSVGCGPIARYLLEIIPASDRRQWLRLRQVLIREVYTAVAGAEEFLGFWLPVWTVEVAVQLPAECQQIWRVVQDAFQSVALRRVLPVVIRELLLTKENQQDAHPRRDVAWLDVRLVDLGQFFTSLSTVDTVTGSDQEQSDEQPRTQLKYYLWDVMDEFTSSDALVSRFPSSLAQETGLRSMSTAELNAVLDRLSLSVRNTNVRTSCPLATHEDSVLRKIQLDQLYSGVQVAVDESNLFWQHTASQFTMSVGEPFAVFHCRRLNSRFAALAMGISLVNS